MKLSWLQVKNVDKIDNEMRRLPPEHISFQLLWNSKNAYAGWAAVI